MLSNQAKKVLEVIKKHGVVGVHPTTLIFEAGATQPNARIFDIREYFGCTHKHSDVCFATEHIINKRLPNGTTVYVYTQTKSVMEQYYKEHMEEREKRVNNQEQISLL